VLVFDAALLTTYTFSCHSCRHLIGGNVDCHSCAKFGGARLSLWKRVTSLNEHHMLIAWVSLFWVAFTDLYVMLVAMGTIRDVRLF
jgi:hypothetical protein